MKKMTYHPTALEQWVVNFYRNLKIYDPKDIDEQSICRFLGIFLYYKDCPSMSFEQGKFKSITIDKRISSEKQREHFYHELCHILRHSGWQLMIPLAFKELQEYDARNFTRYAAIPYHMIKYFDLRDPYVLDEMSERFKVSKKLCQERLQKMKANSRLKPVI